MFSRKSVSQSGQTFEMTFFPSLPRNEEVKKLKKFAFDLWMIYVALDHRHHEFGQKALEKEALFERQYKATHFGTLPERHEYISEIKRLAKEHLIYQANTHGTVDLHELLKAAELSDEIESALPSSSLSAIAVR